MITVTIRRITAVFEEDKNFFTITLLSYAPAPSLSVAVFLPQLIKAKEQVSHSGKGHRENRDPHQDTGDTLGIQIHEEVGIDQGGSGSGNQNRGIKSQNNRLDQQEDHVGNGETDGGDGVIPLTLSALTEQEPVGNVQNGQGNVEQKASDSPVELRIAAFGPRQHNVEHKEGQQDAEHTDELQHGGNRYVAVLLLLGRLNQAGEHNAEAKEIADVGEVNVEIPADRVDVIENSRTGHTAHEGQGAVDRIKDQLCRSVFNHNLIIPFRVMIGI